MIGLRRALVLTTAERYVGLVCNFATLAFVSRQLTPSEIGVSVLGTSVGVVALSVREFASLNFLVQKRRLEDKDVSSAITLLAIVSAAIAAGIVAVSDSVAAIYHAPVLQAYCAVIACAILIETIGAPIAALLRRDMAFTTVASINVLGILVYSGLTAALVLLGFGVMSFAWAWLASASTISIVSMVVWRDRRLFRFSVASWREMVGFGGVNGVNVLLFRLYDAVPYFVLGRILPLHAMALYSRAVTICQLPEKVFLGGLGPALLPALSNEVRSGRDIHGHFILSVRFITVFMWPALAVLTVLTEPVVRIVLGPQWMDAVPIVRIIAVGALFSFASELSYPILVALGSMRDVLYRSLLVWPASAAVLIAASFFGLTAAAASWLLIVPFQAFVSLWFVKRRIGVAWGEIGKALGEAAILAGCSVAGPLGVAACTNAGLAFTPATLTAAVMLSATGWLLGLRLTSHPLLDELGAVLGALRRPWGLVLDRALALRARR